MTDFEPQVDEETDDAPELDDPVVAAGLAEVEQNGNSDPVESLRGLMQYLLDNLLEDSSVAQLTLEQRGQMVAIQVQVPEEELGKIIGRGGRIAKAMRAALMVAGSRYHLRVSLDIES